MQKESRVIMNKQKFFLLVIAVLFFLLLPIQNLLAQDETDNVLDLALDMFKFDQYLPAIDLLEENLESQKEEFNYWLYLGLAYQRTRQYDKALDSFKQASKLNPNASNLKTRIKNLNAIIDDKGTIIKDFKTDSEKASWLLQEAESLRNSNKEEKAFRTFIQAVEYNANVLGNDKDFVRRGTVYYRLKLEEKAEFSLLFYAIFKYFEGNISESYRIIYKFVNDNSNKPLAIRRMAKYYLEKITEANDRQKDIDQAEKEERIKIAEEKKLAAKNKQKQNEKQNQKKQIQIADGTKKQKKTREKQDVDELEQKIKEETFNYKEDFDFIEKYSNYLALEKSKEYFGITDMKRKKQIIWEIAQTSSQSDETMNVVIDGLTQNNIEFVQNSVYALRKIGLPSADKAMPTLLSLAESERPDFRYLAVEAIGKIKTQPELVIPKLIEVYNSEKNDFLKKHYVRCATNYGKIAQTIGYKILDEHTRLEREPIAKFIHDMTGEKIEDLINSMIICHRKPQVIRHYKTTSHEFLRAIFRWRGKW